MKSLVSAACSTVTVLFAGSVAQQLERIHLESSYTTQNFMLFSAVDFKNIDPFRSYLKRRAWRTTAASIVPAPPTVIQTPDMAHTLP